MKPNKARLLSYVCVVMSAACKSFAADTVPPTSRQDYDIVLFGSHEKRVPKYFHAGLSIPKSPGGYAAIDMIVNAPDLTPLLRPPSDPGWSNQLTILIEYSLQFRNSYQILELKLAQVHHAEEDYVRIENGCKMYGNILMSDIVACQTGNGLLVASCAIKDQFVKSPSCKIMENLDDETHVIYTYSRSYVGNIVEIDDRVRRLYASFSMISP